MKVGKLEKNAAALRGDNTRRRVLDAAERLLREGNAEFSMRDLAAAAGLSFATPFNHFGCKGAIMYALSARRIAAMEARYAACAPTGDAGRRVARAVEIAARVMLEEAAVNKVVMTWLGAGHAAPGEVLRHSASLWANAIGSGDGLRCAGKPLQCRELAEHLAFGFRGVLSFWTAGEVADDRLVGRALAVAKRLMASAAA